MTVSDTRRCRSGTASSLSKGHEVLDSSWQETDFDDVSFVAGVAACRLTALDGSSLRVRDAWGRAGDASPARGTQTVVHVFLRQFGCLFCHELVAQIIGAAPQIQSHDAHIVLVGCGSVDQAVRFGKAKRLPRVGVSLYADESQASFRAASLVRGLGPVFFSKGSLGSYRRARGEGFRITGISGDVAQLGGVMVVAPPAGLRLLHRSEYAGDHPSMSEIIAALEE